jgi:hypothetical protein
VAVWEQGLHQLVRASVVTSADTKGWAWADASDVVDHVTTAMKRMRPTPEELAQFQSLPRSAFDSVAAQRQRDLDRDNTAVQAALKLWPSR